MTDFEIVHNRDDSRFETSVDGLTAVLLYRPEGSSIVFVSTRVPPPIEGRGIGSALARAGLKYARAQ